MVSSQIADSGLALPTGDAKEKRTVKAGVFRPKQKAPGSFPSWRCPLPAARFWARSTSGPCMPCVSHRSAYCRGRSVSASVTTHSLPSNRGRCSRRCNDGVAARNAWRRRRGSMAMVGTASREWKRPQNLRDSSSLASTLFTLFRCFLLSWVCLMR